MKGGSEIPILIRRAIYFNKLSGTQVTRVVLQRFINDLHVQVFADNSIGFLSYMPRLVKSLVPRMEQTCWSFVNTGPDGLEISNTTHHYLISAKRYEVLCVLQAVTVPSNRPSFKKNVLIGHFRMGVNGEILKCSVF